jgi:hypoxanthine-guanine phosphoribosyltransferase
MKEYGSDFFQMQSDAVKKGQKVLIVDDIIATGKPFKNPSTIPSVHSRSSGARLLLLEIDANDV